MQSFYSRLVECLLTDFFIFFRSFPKFSYKRKCDGTVRSKKKSGKRKAGNFSTALGFLLLEFALERHVQDTKDSF